MLALALARARSQADYPRLVGAPAGFYFELYHFCTLLVLRQNRDDAGYTAADAAEDVREVLETFENEPAALTFLAGIFADVAARSRAAPADFDAFAIDDLGDLAHLGMEVRNQLTQRLHCSRSPPCSYRAP